MIIPLAVFVAFRVSGRILAVKLLSSYGEERLKIHKKQLGNSLTAIHFPALHINNFICNHLKLSDL
ncbi:hypothetical protein T07_4045 [Trichinella nelsoni]|uniref:Uncharacterized protein n=1 Tax=Trichinella nelsoni TaxID=6336 RepID=A0A0V0RR83_9BILA|nr:hypothetical protein T07_4045 [Trichinella nelsoni]